MAFRNRDKTTGNSLSTKIIIMVEVILLISSILFCSVSVYRARDGIRKAIQQRMLDIANCAAGSVDGDYLAKLSEEEVGSDEYNALYKKLAVFRDNVELEYIYSIKKEGDGNFIFTMDLDQVSPASYGDSVKYTDALSSAGDGKAAVDEVPYSDKWGKFYSAYSPVFDSDGNVAGIIAVDFSADWFESQQYAQMRSTVISYLIILLICLLVAALLSFITVRPFVRSRGQLLEEKVRAESANNAKSDFLANMSHEIRTPINAVLGMNEMILREGRKIQEDQKDDASFDESVRNIVVYAGEVDNAGHNLLALVNDILDFSKIEAGRMDLVEAPYRLSDMLSGLREMAHLRAGDKGLEVTIDVDSSVPDELCGDEVRIRQVFTNILGNAIKYTEKGSVRVTVGGSVQGDGKILLRFAVKDTGIGIRKDDLDKLFTRFQRLEMDRNSTVEGTGLGLVITQRLLDMMDGKIEVDSVYGKGSTFTVTIPQKVVSGEPIGDLGSKTKERETEAEEYRESFSAPDARVLIVDDTKINILVVVNLMKDTMIRFDAAYSGAEAVEMAKENKYDVILMDQRMPGMDGTQALHAIRDTSDGASKDVPVICLTADAVVGAREKYLAEGFSEYITKPVDSYALERMLQKFIPDDKIERTDAGRDSADAEHAAEEFEGLRVALIDPVTGLKFCDNNAGLYRSLLAEFVQSMPEKSGHMRETFAAKDWKDYSVYVHALKSSSKMLGATQLSEEAAKLEAAAKANDADTVAAGHEDMLDRYERTAKIIAAFVPAAKEDAKTGDVLEFEAEDK